MVEEGNLVQQEMESKKKIEVKGKMELKSTVNEFGDGVSWYRGAMLGKGSFGYVYLTNLKNPKSKNRYLPSVMAVKSAEVSVSGSIQKEREVLNNIKGCPYIIRCFGDETTTGKNGMMTYNLLLEYGSGGNLADRIQNLGNKGLPEFEVRSYTRSMLRGLNHIHAIGYVHCDMKPENILLVSNSSKGSSTEFRAKIGDLGLAKRENQRKKRRLEPYWRGTPMYLSPEAVTDNVQESPADIWALGCIVLEMLTGKPPWDRKEDMVAEDVLRKIREGHDLPEIPGDLSKEAKNFLKGCFVKNPRYRLTAEMLLIHPFVEGLNGDDRVEEVEEVEDINEVDSMQLVTDTDDEFCYSQEDWSCISEEDNSLGYWSEDDTEIKEDEMTSYISEEGILKVEERMSIRSSSIDSGFNSMIDTSMWVSSQNPLTNSSKCPLKFTIPAGV